MGLVKKMEWLKWIRKYSTGILDTKTGSMETLIDSASSKTINYAYTSSVIADDEFITVATPPHQRPMLPPPQDSSQDLPQLPNDVYDCCVSLDGIPIKQEFQYTLSDTDGCGKITKHDIEGLASKILESMYGTTIKFSSRGQRTVKVTLNVRQSTAVQGGTGTMPSWSHQLQGSRERKNKPSSADKADQQQHNKTTNATESPAANDADCPVYGVKGSPHHKVKPGAQRYRRDQLVEMVQRSLAENLSFQNQRKSNKPEGYHRPRTKRRQTSTTGAVVGTLQVTPLSSPPSKPKTSTKVAWSPYDFEPVAHVPQHHHHHEKYLRNHHQHGVGEEHVQVKLRQQVHRAAAVINSEQHPKDAQEQTKNIDDHLRYKRAKLASKKIHHHIHEHHHYHHYDYYIV